MEEVRNWPERDLHFSTRAIVFLALFFFYIWMRIDPRLIYHVQEPVFFRGWAFFRDFLAYPGGLTEYLSAFLSQSFYVSWFGALTIIAVAWLVCVCTRAFTEAVGGVRCGFLPFVPAILLTVLHNRYRYALGYDLGLLFALLFLVAYVRTPLDRSAARGLVFLGLSVPLYWTVAGPYSLYAVLCGIFELLTGRRFILGLACLLSALVLPYLAAAWAFPGHLSEAYLRLLPFTGDYFIGDSLPLLAAIGLYLFFPLVGLALGWRSLATREVPVSRDRSLPLSGGDALKWTGQTLALLVLAAVPIHSSLDGNYRTLLKVDYHARHQEWEQVIREARDLMAYNVLAVYNIQRALCHLSRLSGEMFAYPHLPNEPIFQPSAEAPSDLMAVCDLLLEMGHVNKAEHMANEALEIYGDRPTILQRLVLINVLKERIPAARVYLGLLDKTLLHRDWAQGYRRALDADPLLSNDGEVAKIRSLMIEDDYPGYFTPEVLLLQLLDHNKQNMLAFDFLMAHYLQTGRLDGIAANIGRLNDFPDLFPLPDIPHYYEEALLLYMMQGRQQLGKTPRLPLHGRRISAQTTRRFGDFSRVLAAYKKNEGQAHQVLATDHRSTYWFYYLFRNSERETLPISRASPLQ